MWFIKKQKMGTGMRPDPTDDRDLEFEKPFGAAEVDWEKGFDIEKELSIKIPLKDQNGSESCVGQAWAYYQAVVDAKELGYYSDKSAKAIYSQIYLPSGGSYIRDGAKLWQEWGAIAEFEIPSYDLGQPPKEEFFRETAWKTAAVDKEAKPLQVSEYRTIKAADNMDLFAIAIRDNLGVVGGLAGSNNGTWSSFEPKPPTGKPAWYHALYFGKFGIDSKGKYIATPNSWGNRGVSSGHPDGWQRLRADYFTNDLMFNPWTVVDKPNTAMSEETYKLMQELEKKIVTEGEGPGRKGIIINGELREITKERAAEACLYALTNNGFGKTVPSSMFNEMKKGKPF